MRFAFLALAVSLAFPAIAIANHVPGTTYEGRVTTGQGGQVTLTVSGDGTTVDAEFQNLGHVSQPCTGVGFATDPVPITNHSFTFTSSDGLRTASGTFGPSAVQGGAQVLTTPCTTGSQAWYVAGPDGGFGTDTPGELFGVGVFDPNGVGQTQELQAKPGKTAVFDVGIINQATSSESFGVKGCKSSKGFKVKYSDETGNVTGDVTQGSYETRSLASIDVGNDLHELTLKVKALSDAKPGKTKSCKVAAESDLFTDVIKAKTKVKGG
ncbi:MAG: hypothetical protein QOI31_2858 [Solirubrobacterales bacterium]|nr:hypothetical protein [Solirubrobacterales bacterium]